MAWCRARLHRCCYVLLPGCDHRLLGLRQPCHGQHSYVRGKANMGDRHGQSHGCHSCHRELPSKLSLSLPLRLVLILYSYRFCVNPAVHTRFATIIKHIGCGKHRKVFRWVQLTCARLANLICLLATYDSLSSFLVTLFLFYQFFQIYAMPVFDMLETILVKRIGIRPSILLRLITRSTYVGMWTSNLNYVQTRNPPKLYY